MPPTRPVTRPRRRRFPRKTRDDWIVAGWTVVCRDGQAGLTLDAVVAEIGVTKGSLYSLFGDWPRYVDALLRWWATTRYDETFRRSMDQAGTPEDRLRAYLALGMELDIGGRALRLWALDDPELRDEVADGDRRSVEVFTNLLIEAGVPPDVANFRAWVLYTAFMGLYLLTPPDDVRHDAQQIVGWLLTPPGG